MMPIVNFLVGILLAIAGLSLAAAGEVDPNKLDSKKHTPQALYLTAKEAFELVQQQRGRILFVDVRTQPELEFVGVPEAIDANIPYVLNDLSAWDDSKEHFKKVHNSDFLTAIEDRLRLKKLGQNDKIVLICRSGDRSASAAALLHKAGYKNVYSVTDGFEGDKASQGPYRGKRTVNGWKNAGLPWTYSLNKNQMYWSE